MKKLLTIMFTIGIVIGLVACSNDEDVVDDTESDDNKTADVEQQEEQEADIEQEEDTDEEVDKETDEQNTMISDYEEASIIEDEIDLDGLEVEMETDNDNNRVLLFLDGNEAVYKTVYIKRDHRLKIIDIVDNEGQIYNDTIK